MGSKPRLRIRMLTLMDRYKAKIGLKSAYDDQKKALEKLKKNDKIDDENTRRLNASVLSKAINDSNDTVNGLEGRFTDFANVDIQGAGRPEDEEG